jgi:hypothetical protein
MSKKKASNAYETYIARADAKVALKLAKAVSPFTIAFSGWINDAAKECFQDCGRSLDESYRR